MDSLRDAKYLGGIGSILILLLPAPNVGFILYIIGIVLVAIAVKKIADAVGDSSIFNDMLISIILLIVGGAVGVVVGLALGLASFAQIFSRVFTGDGLPTDFTEPEAFQLFWGIFIAIFAALAVVWAFSIASSIFLRRSYGLISKRLGAGLFATAGLLYLIGAALAIILIGFVILFVAVVVQIVAFFTLPEYPPAPQSQTI
ncbi:hypothetical protein HRbin02_01838 [Candidatus Calditenuaceae archaeon HR02]|nr:hypothetical protein HRbin02_01838 [Candidatus Calditenuaceae archaeon HR02]